MEISIDASISKPKTILPALSIGNSPLLSQNSSLRFVRRTKVCPPSRAIEHAPLGFTRHDQTSCQMLHEQSAPLRRHLSTGGRSGSCWPSNGSKPANEDFVVRGPNHSPFAVSLVRDARALCPGAGRTGALGRC